MSRCVAYVSKPPKAKPGWLAQFRAPEQFLGREQEPGQEVLVYLMYNESHEGSVALFFGENQSQHPWPFYSSLSSLLHPAQALNKIPGMAANPLVLGKSFSGTSAFCIIGLGSCPS